MALNTRSMALAFLLALFMATAALAGPVRGEPRNAGGPALHTANSTLVHTTNSTLLHTANSTAPTLLQSPDAADAKVGIQTVPANMTRERYGCIKVNAGSRHTYDFDGLLDYVDNRLDDGGDGIDNGIDDARDGVPEATEKAPLLQRRFLL